MRSKHENLPLGPCNSWDLQSLIPVPNEPPLTIPGLAWQLLRRARALVWVGRAALSIPVKMYQSSNYKKQTSWDVEYTIQYTDGAL